MPCTIASRYRYGINSSSRLKPEWPGWRVVPGRSVWETRERERPADEEAVEAACQWDDSMSLSSPVRTAIWKIKGQHHLLYFPTVFPSLSLCPPALKTGSLFIPSPGFKCHLVLSTWTMWNFSSHSFGADFLFIFWPVRFRWIFECPCEKRWLYVCIFRTLIFIV